LRKVMVMEPPLVSIIVPFLDEEECLAHCLDSLIRLNCPASKREIIVVDNNSTDGSAQVAQSYPVHYVFEPRRGAATATNSGAAKAKGDILAFIDADCLAYEDWLEEICRVLADPSVDAVMGVSEGIAGNIWADFRQRQDENFFAEARAEAHNVSKAATASFAIRRKVFVENGGFDESFLRSHDIEFSIRLHRRGYRIVFAPQVRVKHVYPTSLLEIEEARKLDGFFAYRIAMKYDEISRQRYFPEFSRWYYRHILSENKRRNLLVLDALALSLRLFIGISVLILENLHLLGFGQSLLTLFAFTFDCCFLYGKILARLLEQDCHLKPFICHPSLVRRLEIAGCLARV
jgi:glycosyltransferase involved in cell wall biosynthesis